MKKNEDVLQKLADHLPKLALSEDKLRKSIEFVQKLDNKTSKAKNL